VLNGVSPDFFSSGTAQVAVRVSGSFEDPRLIGTASLTDGSVSVLLENERWTVANLKTAVRFTANQAQIDSLEARIGGGRITASGGALLEGFRVSAFRISLNGHNMTVPFPQDFRSTLDADVEIRGSSREQLIGGLVTLRRAEYTKDIELADLINTRASRSKKDRRSTWRAPPFSLHCASRQKRARRAKQSRRSRRLRFAATRRACQRSDDIGSNHRHERHTQLPQRSLRHHARVGRLAAGRNADPIINIQGESQIRGYRVIVSLTGPLSQPRLRCVQSRPCPGRRRFADHHRTAFVGRYQFVDPVAVGSRRRHQSFD
jgi:hypothetical protein